MLKLGAIFNLVGQVTTAAIAILTVAIYTDYFGVERYGCYLLLIAILPYFALFDNATSRISTNLIALRVDDSDVRTLTYFGVSVASLSALVFLVFYPLISHYFSNDATVVREVDAARPAIAGMIGITTLLALQQAHLEGYNRFGTSNMLQVFGTITSTFVPLVPGIYDGSFEWLTYGVLLGRVIQFALGFAFVERGFWKPPRLSQVSSLMRSLPEIGWFVFTAILSILSATIDRILLGFSYGAAQLYYYAVPTSVATRLILISLSLAKGLAPTFAQKDEEKSARLNVLGTEVVVVVVSGLTLLFSAFATDLLTLWIDADFARKSSDLLRIALVGMLGLSLSQVSGLLLQSTGRTALIVKLQLYEIVPYVTAIVVASWYGLAFVASVMAIRNVLDGLAHMYLSGQTWKHLSRVAAFVLLHIVALFAFGQFDQGPLVYRFIALIVAAIVFLAAFWLLFRDAMQQIISLAWGLSLTVLGRSRRLVSGKRPS